VSGAAEAAEHLRGLGLERILHRAWVKLGRYGVAGRLSTADLGPAELRALESVLGARPGRSVEVRRLDAALRASPFACGLGDVAAAMFGPPAEARAVRTARRASEVGAFLGAATPAWVAAGVPQGIAETVLWAELARARRSRTDAQAAVGDAARAVAAVLADPPARRGGALLGILANAVTGNPHAFDAGTTGGRLLLGALGAPPGAGALRRQQALAAAGIAVDGVSYTVAVRGIAAPEDPTSAAAAAAGRVLVAPLRHVLRWELPAGIWSGRTVAVLENPPVFEALVERGLPPGAALVCTSGFPSAAAVVLLHALRRAGAAVRYSGDFDGNGLQIAARVLALGEGLWRPWRMGPEDYAASARAAAGRPVREPDERRVLEALASGGPLAATAAAILQGGAVAYQESLVDALWADLREPAGPDPAR
jgi:uncharacterized protein (TIGR02679 family)